MALAATVAVAAFGSAPALAGTASVSGTTLSYAALPGETNAVTIAASSYICGPVCFRLTYEVTDTGAAVTAGDGCEVRSGDVHCAASVGVPNIALITVATGDGNDAVTIQSVWESDPASIMGGSGDDVLTGGPGDDLIYGYGGCIELFSSCGDGSDTIYGGEGNDTVGGGYSDCSPFASCADSADILYGGAGDDSLGGDANGDAIYGEAGADSLEGGSGGDTLLGGDGDDQLSPGTGSDSVDGGANTDRVRAGGTNITLTAAAVVTGSETASLAGIEAATLTGTFQSNTIDASAFPGPVEVNAEEGSDTVLGGPQNDDLDGGGEDDTLVGNGGDDQLSGGNGVDVLTGGPGADTIDGGATVLDRLVESADVNLTLTNSALTGLGGDTLSGIEGATLTGGAGSNTIDASAFSGAVVLDGGAGDDALTAGSAVSGDVLSGGAGADTIAGGGGSSDRLVETRDTDLTLTDTALTGPLDGDTLSGIERATLAGGPSGNTFDTSGFSGAVNLIGEGGDDVLIAGSGPDELSGGPGDDTVTGGGGGLLYDTLTGGGGEDTLIESGAAFRVTDTVLFVNGESTGDAFFTGIEVADLTGTNGGETLDASAFSGRVVLTGLGGADVLKGAAGIDQFDAGPGDDEVRSQDASPESPICGDGADIAWVDASDTPAGDCETVSPAVTITDSSMSEGGPVMFTVTLSNAFPYEVTVNYQTEGDTATEDEDYTAASGTLTFEPDDTEETVTVSTTEDGIDEAPETFQVNLSGAVNATLDDEEATGTITDNDPAPALSIDDVGVAEGNAGTVTATFTITLDGLTEQTVSVDWATADQSAAAGSDYTADGDSVSFAPGEDERTVEVLVIGDTVFEPVETFAVNLSGPVNAGIADGQGIGTIANDDAAPPAPPPAPAALPAITISNAKVKEGNRGKKAMTFLVQLSAASATPVTVGFKTQKGTAKPRSDFLGRSGTLTIAPGQTQFKLVVKIKGDLRDERNEKFKVLLANVAGATLLDAEGVGTIRDND